MRELNLQQLAELHQALLRLREDLQQQLENSSDGAIRPSSKPSTYSISRTGGMASRRNSWMRTMREVPGAMKSASPLPRSFSAPTVSRMVRESWRVAVA